MEEHQFIADDREPQDKPREGVGTGALHGSQRLDTSRSSRRSTIHRAHPDLLRRRAVQKERALQDMKTKELKLSHMKRRHESETDLAAAEQNAERSRLALEQLQNAKAGEEAGFAEEAARREAEWAESNAKLEAEHAEKLRQAGDDILKAVQAVRELDSQGQSLSTISWWSPGRPSPKSWSS